MPANMTEEDDILALFRAHEERFGRLDALVNNAGMGFGAAIRVTVSTSPETR